MVKGIDVYWAGLIDRLLYSYRWGLIVSGDQSEAGYIRPSCGKRIDFRIDGGDCADPFGITVSGRHFVFYESKERGKLCGDIRYLEVTSNLDVIDKGNALRLKSHLSYPFVFEESGDIYMVPENGDELRVPLYRAVDFPMHWEFECNLLTGMKALDSTLVVLPSGYYMFVYTEEDGGRLSLYYSQKLKTGWELHPSSPIRTGVQNTRPAGKVAVINGKMIRPAQNGWPRYGNSITYNEILEISPWHYQEIELVTTAGKDIENDFYCFHTMNQLPDVGCLYDYMYRELDIKGVALKIIRQILKLAKTALCGSLGRH